MNIVELAFALSLPGVGLGLLRFSAQEGGLTSLSAHDIAQMGLGYLIVVVLLVPLMKWLMSYVSKQGESKDTMLMQSVDALKAVTEATRETLTQFQRFEEEEKRSHEAIVLSQQRILAFLEQLEAKFEKTLSK